MKKKLVVEARGGFCLGRFPRKQTFTLVVNYYAYPRDGSSQRPYQWHYYVARFLHHRIYTYVQINRRFDKITLSILEESYEFD